ncbi:MAG: hypothetical protein CVU78_05010 [Elusimicrobia bacterium HGW-Elusimicrobia-2]|nr:MAG: hypothetical protein CVU78_05010 [Elusimicrobia bacterium HGW-Elusimicrobia-2]
MKKILLTALLAAAFIAQDAHSSGESRKSNKLYKAARADIRKGLYLTAYDKLSEAYWLDPFNGGALKEMDRITKSFKKNLAEWCEYDFEQKSYGSGFLFYTQGDYKNAVKEWEKVLMVKENREVRDYYEYISGELKKGMEKEKLLYGGKAKLDRENAEKLKEEEKNKNKAVKKPPPPAPKSPPKAAPSAPPKPQEPKIDKAKAEKYYNEGLQQYSQGYLKLAAASWKKTLKYNPAHTRAQRALTRAEKMLQTNE